MLAISFLGGLLLGKMAKQNGGQGSADQAGGLGGLLSAGDPVAGVGPEIAGAPVSPMEGNSGGMAQMLGPVEPGRMPQVQPGIYANSPPELQRELSQNEYEPNYLRATGAALMGGSTLGAIQGWRGSMTAQEGEHRRGIEKRFWGNRARGY